MKHILSILILSLTIGCSSDDKPSIDKPGTLYWQTRHDQIPVTMLGEWVSVSDRTDIVLNVTDQKVMTEHFTIDREQDNVVKVNDSTLFMYQGKNSYKLAFGKGIYSGQITITANNDCYDTVVTFEPTIPQPEPEQPQVPNPEIN